MAAVVPTVRQAIGTYGFVLVDGLLAPTWNWRNTDGMLSGKHARPGFTVQIASAIGDVVAAVGNPIPGTCHDTHAFHAPARRTYSSATAPSGDKGYQGHTTVHLIRKPPGHPQPTHDKQFNHDISSIRSAVKRANTHLQNWRILATPFRPPLNKFPATLRAVVGLYFLKRAYE